MYSDGDVLYIVYILLKEINPIKIIDIYISTTYYPNHNCDEYQAHIFLNTTNNSFLYLIFSNLGLPQRTPVTFPQIDSRLVDGRKY